MRVSSKPPSQSFNLDGILIERLQEFLRASNMILVGDFNAPNINWQDITTPSHESSFDARLLSFCLNNFLVQHSILATRSVLGQRENCLDLVFTKLPEDILSFERGPQLGNTDHLSLCFDYVCFTCPNPSENRKRNLWKGDFEGMKRHLHLQNWDTMPVGDIETKWLGSTAVLLDHVEKFCPLSLSKRPLAKLWLSRHISRKKLKKKLHKIFLLTRSHEHWACYKNHDRLNTKSLRRSRAAYEKNVITGAIRNAIVLFRCIREGAKKRSYPRVGETKWLHLNQRCGLSSDSSQPF